VADDEEFERKAIRLIVNKNCSSIDQIWDAENGRQVMEICRRQKPDILFLDIRMPGLTGLEAAKELRKIHPGVRIVFLTAYHEFEYAHEAIRIGVDDFILKPASDERILEVIEKVTHRLDEERKREADVKRSQDRLEQVSQLFTNELLATLILRPLPSETVRTYFEVLDIHFSLGILAVFQVDYESYPIRIESSPQRLLLKRRCMLKVKRELEARMIRFLVHEQEDVFYVLILPGKDSSKEYTSEAEIQDLFQSLATVVRKDLGLPLRVGISHRFTQPEEIHRAFGEARAALEGTRKEEEVVVWQGIREGVVSVPRTEALIHKALDYIARHYGEEITLESMASHVRLSSFYFSKTFKQYTGVTFIDYLSLYRVEKAKEILKDPRWSIKEISVRVGYSDPNYFTRVFRRLEGLTPSEYRSLVLGGKEQNFQEKNKT
jgi:two-component system response regulator YesN